MCSLSTDELVARWRARFRLRSVSYGGQVALPTLRDHAFFSTDTKNPSVPVRRGVISQPSSERSAACSKSSALSQSTRAVSFGGWIENSEWRPMKALTCSLFSLGNTEHVT